MEEISNVHHNIVWSLFSNAWLGEHYFSFLPILNLVYMSHQTQRRITSDDQGLAADVPWYISLNAEILLLNQFARKLSWKFVISLQHTSSWNRTGFLKHKQQ